jgi:competence protein ComEC
MRSRRRSPLGSPGAGLVALLVFCALAVPVSAASKAPRGLDVYWIDVEGGAATLLVTPAGESILVDTGWPGPRDAERIRRVVVEEAGLARIDHLVITHWHTDHFGGVADLAAVLPIARYYDHGFPAGAPPDINPEQKEAYLKVTGGQSTVLRPGDALSLRAAPGSPGVSARVVSSHGFVVGEQPNAPQTRACRDASHQARPDDTSDNQRSLGLVFSFGAFELLDLGDLTWNVEHKLACPKNLVGKVDAYQATHHGLDQSNNPVLVRAVAPAVAIVNNGPKKGGTPEAYRTLVATVGAPNIFQLHRNVKTTPDENAPAALVANDEEACHAHWIRLRVAPDAKKYTVEIPNKKTSRSYDVR